MKARLSPHSKKPKHLRLPLLGAVLALGVAMSSPAAASDTGELARLVSPAPGATLTAGASVVLEWEARPPLATMPHVEEWEAFLSLDGGRTFLTRLTPHLETGMRRVTVRLPELPSDDARLLLRFGDERDERDEREQVLPARYRIAAAGHPGVTWRWPRLGRGEPVHPGAPGVLVWVEGGRDGEGWSECEGERGGDVWESAVAPGAVCLRGLGPVSSPMPKLLRASLGAYEARVVAAVAAATAPIGGAKSPRLAALCRRNV